MAEHETHGAPSPRAGGGRSSPFNHHHHHHFPPSLNPATEAFGSAITQMYLGRSANPLLLRHGLNGPISTEHLRSRTSSVSSQATRRGPLRADHTLQTPRSANDREIEEINRQAEAVERARQRNPKPRPQRPLSAQLHPTYFTDLADDTDPTSPRDRSCDATGAPRPNSARRRVYLIKRPQSAPVYGRITPVSCRSQGPSSGRGSTDLREQDTVAGDDSRVRVVSEGHFNPSSAGESPVSHSNGELLSNSGVASARGLDSTLSTQRSDVEVNSGKESFQTVSLTSQSNSQDSAPEGVRDSLVTGGRNSLAEPGAKEDLDTNRSGNASPVRFVENEKERKLHREGSFHVTPVRFVENEKETKLHREGSFHVTPVPVKRVRDTSVHTDQQNKDTNSDSHSDSPEPQTRSPEHLLQSCDTRPPPTPTFINIIQQHARDTQHEESLHLSDSSPSDREAVLRNLAKALRLQSEAAASAHSSAEEDSDFDDEGRLHLSEHTQHILSSAYTPKAEGPNSFSELNTAVDFSASRREKREALSASAEILVHERPLDSKSVSRHRATNDSGSSVAKENRSNALAAVSDSHLASSTSRLRPQTQPHDSPATNVPTSTGLRTHFHSPRDPQSARSAQTQIPTASSTLTRESPRESSSSLQTSRGAFGSVDSLLVGLDAETKTSVKKNKNKKSLFKNWFTPKRGKYNPGEESIPVIESAPLDRFDRRISDTRNVHNPEASKDNTFRIRKSSAPPSFSRSDELSDRSVGPAVKEKEHTCVTPESPASDVMDGSLTARSQKSETSQQDTALSEVVASSRSDSVTSSTVRAVSHSSKQTLTSISKKKTMEVSESQTTSSSVLKTESSSASKTESSSASKTESSSASKTESSSASKTESSDSSLSLLSAQLLGRGNASAGAYENTRVASNSNVTRRQMITIQGSALNSYDKSIMLTDSGFPEELSSTFKAKPVMVRERKVSPLSPHGSKESLDTLSPFGRQRSNSPSSLSLVEIDPSGAMRLSPKHGSREDLDLFSKASKIVHAQRSEDTLENDVSNDDDHELVVIREYVFAARKHGPGDSTPTTPRVEITSSETNTISSTTVQSSVHSTLETRGQESSTTLHSSFRSSRKANDEEEELSQVSSTSALKEDDSGLDSPPSMQDALPLPPTKPKRTGRASREIDVTEISHLRSKSSEEMTASDDTLLTKKQQQSVFAPGVKPGSKGDSHDDDSTESEKTQSPGGLEKHGVTVNVSSSPVDAAVVAAGSRPTQEKEESADVGDNTRSIDSQKDTKQDLTSTGSKLSDTSSNNANLDEKKIIVADAVKSSLFHASATADKSTKDKEQAKLSDITSNKANLDEKEIIVADAVKSSLVHASASADKSTKEEEHHFTVESDSKPVHAVTVKSKEAEDKTENSPEHSGPEAFVNRLFQHKQAVKRKVKTTEATSLGSADGKSGQDTAEPSVPDNVGNQSAGSAPAGNFSPAPQKEEQHQPDDAISKELSLSPSSVTDIYASPQKKGKGNEVSSSPDTLVAKSTKDLPGEARKDVPAQDDTKADVSVTEFAAAAVSALYAVPQKKQKESTQPESTSADSDSQSSLGPIYAKTDKKRKFGVQRGTYQDLSKDAISRTSEKDAVVESGIIDKKAASDLHVSADMTKTSHLDADGGVEAKENIPEDEIKMSSAATVMAQKQPQKHHTGQDDNGGEPQGKAADKDSKGNNDTTQEITGAAPEAARKVQDAGTTDEKNVLHASNSAECSKSTSRLNRQRDSLTEEEYHKPWSSDFSSLEDDIRSRIASAFPSAEEEQENEYEQPLTEDKPASESAVKAAAASPNHYAMKELNRLSQGETISDNVNLSDETSHPTADHAKNPDAADSQSSKAGTDAINVYSEVHCGPESEKATENIAALVSAVPTISTTPTTARKISDNRLDKPPLPLTPSPGARKVSDTRLDRPPLPRTPSPSATRKISDNRLDRPPLPRTPSPSATRKISDTSSNRSPVLMCRSPAPLRTISDNGLDRPPLPLTPAPPATRKISDNRLDKPALSMAPSPSAARKMSDDQSKRSPVLMSRSPAAPKKMSDNRTDRPTLPMPPLPPVASKVQKEETHVHLVGAKDEEAKTSKNEKVQDKKEEEEAKPGPEVKADEAKPPTKEKPSKSGSEEKTSPHHHNKLKEKFKKVFSHSSEDKKAAKADQKKGSPSAQKKEMKGAAAPEEDKPTKLGEKKKDKKTPAPEEKRPSPAIAIKDKSETPDENNTSQTEPATQSKNPATEDAVRNKDPNKVKDESTEEKSGEDKGDDKETDAQQSQPLSLQDYQYNVKLPLPPTEAKKLIKAEKKNAAKAQKEEAKGAVPKEDQKISSPKAPHKAFKWFKKKLGNKEKKAPKTKKYSINTAGEEDEAEHEGDGDAEDKPTGRVAPNSDSECSHATSNSSSESDNESNEGEKKKPKKKLPFWKGKKDKKKKAAAENESDSDTSAEESKSKLFSWSLGRKKDTSDQEDNLPAGSKKNADWTQGEDASGVSGTFRKISDNVTQSQLQPSHELTKKNAKEGQTSEEQDGSKEASLSKSNAGPPLKSKPKPERTTKSKPEADSKDQGAQPAHLKPNNAVKESVAEKGEEAIKNSQPDASVGSSQKSPSSARPKLFVIGDSEGLKGKARDIGDYTMLRQDATLTQKDTARSPKLPKNSGYELARPLFLEDEGNRANGVLSNKAKTPEDATAMSAQVDKLESLAKAEATDLKKVNGEPQHEAAEDFIIPVKADRPVHQALKLLEKSSNEDPRTDKSDIPDNRVGAAKSSVSKTNPGQRGMYPPSPVLGPKMDKPPVSVKPRPKLRKEEAVRDPAVEDEIIPSKAEEESRGQRLSTNLAFKPKTPKPDTRDDTNNKVTTDPKNVDVDTDTLTGAKEKVHGAASEVTNPSSNDVDTPRSNTDSIGSPGRTYIDGSDFLDTAKASWGVQENKSTVSEQQPSPKSSPSMTNANRKNAAGFASLLNESKKVKAEFKEAGKTNSEEHPPDANSCKPSELACSLESKSVVDDKINPETTSTVQSPPYPISQSTNASISSPRGLDSQDSKPADKSVNPPKTSPTKPAISAKKPDVRPKLFAKPKISRPSGEKGDTDDLEKTPEPVPAENTSKTEKSASTQSASPSIEINSSIKPGGEMSATNETVSLDVDPATKSTVAASTSESPRREDGGGEKAAVRGKPLPPERSKTADKTHADDESTELQNLTISSPAPKPRTSVKGLKDSPAGVFLKNTMPANSETENEKRERPTVSLQKQDHDSGSNEGVESPQRSALQETASPLSSALSEDSLDTRSAMSHPSTSTWAETDTQSTLGPDAGDFTLSLEPDAKLSGKKKTSRETEKGQGAGDLTLSFDTDSKLSDKVKADAETVADPSAENFTLSLDTDTDPPENKDIPPYATARIKKHSVSSIERSMELEDETELQERKDSRSATMTSAVDSDLTLVTPLSEFNKGKKPAPIFRSTPVSGSTNVSSDVTTLTSSIEEEITVTSVSTISESTTSVTRETVMLMTDTANEQYDSEIYEPIFFDDDTDPKSSKKKRTEAPPVRPEKQRKRQRNLTEIIQPDFKDDDADNMYDVPPARRQFAFPKETSLPVFSVVENPKRNSRGSPRVTRAFEPEPEDSIAPYATYHRPQSLVQEPDPDYMDDENPYMNDDEDDLNNLTGIKSTSTEKRASFDDSAEPIHVSLSELNLKEQSKTDDESIAESISSSEKTSSSESPEKTEVQDEAGEKSKVTMKESDKPKHKLVHLDSVSSDSPSDTESASTSQTEDSKSPKLETTETTEKLEQSSPVSVASGEKKSTEKLEQSSPVSVASGEKKTIEKLEQSSPVSAAPGEKKSTEKLEQSSPVSVASSEKKSTTEKLEQSSPVSVASGEKKSTEKLEQSSSASVAPGEKKPTTEADDQFLTSAEYATSVEEIDKLYAALEKEEEEMERRSSSREQSASPNKSPTTKEPVGRLLSFEEQRACLIPLKSKTEDELEPEPQSEETHAEPSKTASKKKTKKENKAVTKQEKTSKSFNETRKTVTETSVVKVQTTKSFNVFRKTSSQDSSQSEKEEETEEKAPGTKVYQPGFFSRFKKSPSNDASKAAHKAEKKDTYPKQSDHDDRVKKKETSTLHETEDKTKSPVTPETVLSVTATKRKESSTLHETEDKTKSPVTPETVLSVSAPKKKEAASPPKASDVLPPITSYSKLVDKVVHRGEEKHVKIKPEEDSKGQEEADAERKTSFEDDDFSKFQLDFMETSLAKDVLGEAMYAKVRKESTTSSILTEPEAGSAEPAPKRKDSSQKDVENLQVGEKISKVSSLLVSNEASPSVREDKKVESAELVKAPTDEPASTDPGKISDVVQEKKAPKTSSAPRAKPPPPPRKDLALKNTPSAETSEKTTESESDKTASVVPEEKDDLSSLTEPSVAVFAPKAAARKSSLVPPADLDSSEASAEKPKASAKPSLKPRPRPKPRDSVILAAEQVTPREVTVVNKTPSQSDPKSATPPPKDPNLAVTSASGKPDSTQDSIPGEVSDKSQISEQPAISSAQRMAQKVGIRLPAPPKKDSRPEKDSSLLISSKTASLPAGSSLQDDTDSKGDKKKKKRPLSGDAAAAMAESDDDEDDDDYDSEDEETDDDDDDERKAVGVDGESPPLPERQYKKKKTKYNEYSNVIRVDSGRLKDARIRSLSRPSLADTSHDKQDKNSRLRNAVSMEGGLDAHHKKQKVKKNKKTKEATGEDGDKKAKKHFGFNPFKGLFGHKKHKKTDGEEAEKVKDEGDDEDNVYELVDDYPDPKHKKGTTDTKTTPPKPAKKPKAKDHAPPPSHPPIKAVDSSHVSLDIRPIGRLLQLNPDGTQLLELIRPANGNLGVQLTQGNEETLQGKFVSGFVDKSTEKLLSGILNIGDQILKINDRSIDNCPLIEVHDIIDTQQRLKFLVFPAQ